MGWPDGNGKGKSHVCTATVSTLVWITKQNQYLVPMVTKIMTYLLIVCRYIVSKETL